MARIVLGPLKEWNPDIALRYLPIVRIIKQGGFACQVTDIGSGASGIAPYLKHRITGVDTDFSPKAHPLLEPVNSSVLETPFDDRSRPCVISVDMLEHLPPAIRQQAVDELVRVSGKLLVLAVPAGRAAQEHDAEMAELYRRVRGAEFRYLREHVDNGLPDVAQLEDYVRRAMATHGRTGDVELLPNASLPLRSFIAKRWIHRRLFDKAAWVVLIWLSPLLARIRGGVPYRTLAVVRFTD